MENIYYLNEENSVLNSHYLGREKLGEKKMSRQELHGRGNNSEWTSENIDL